jgi:energy-coupling factor transporter ATP-binding protein EcfA2
MPYFYEELVSSIWNRIHHRRGKKRESGALALGYQVSEGQVSKRGVSLSQARRMTHLVIVGLTGSGKSFLVKHIAQWDIDHKHGFALFDQHGDLIPPIQSYLAESGVDPADVILIDPANREWAVGLNPLEAEDDHSRFLMAAEITRDVADRWDFKGARTEELLRNALFVLSANGLTFLEMELLLTDGGYRAQLVKKVASTNVRDYFTLRFDPLSDAMKATMREPVLNKLSEFVGDPHFRHILGQRESTFSFDDALETGKIILVNANKGRLGVHATTFASLALGKLTKAIFRRQQRELYSVLADEFQNIVAANTDFDVLFSEARKFGIGIVTANQFLAQLPPKMRSAVQAVGTRIFFQLSPEDANQVAQEIDGGRSMAERLRNLSVRHFIMKSGSLSTQEVVTPNVLTSKFSAKEFVDCSNQFHAKRRDEIEQDISERRPQILKEAIDDWD